MNKPKNGDMIFCAECQACHTIKNPKDRRSGAMVSHVFAFECKGEIRIAWRNGIMTRGLSIVKPVGERAPHWKDHAPAPARAPMKRRTS